MTKTFNYFRRQWW